MGRRGKPRAPPAGAVVSGKLEPGWLMPHLEENSKRWKVLTAAHSGSMELIEKLIRVIDEDAAPRQPGPAGVDRE